MTVLIIAFLIILVPAVGCALCTWFETTRPGAACDRWLADLFGGDPEC